MKPQSRSPHATSNAPSRRERWLEISPAVLLIGIWAFSAFAFRWDIAVVLRAGGLFFASAHIMTSALRWGFGRMPTRVAAAAICAGGAMAGWMGMEFHMLPEGMPGHWSALAGLLTLLTVAWFVREKSAHGHEVLDRTR